MAASSAPSTLPSGITESAYRRRVQRALGDAYELRQLIGRGGFATVYAARDVRLKRDVAVKLLREDLAASATVQERFRREAEAVAQVRHPHIIPIYAVGEALGLVYYVMPLVAGESLRARLDREGQLGVEEARRLLLEATSALGVAHKAGIVHRDIKPDNILLDGDERRVLLTDFGIAKALSAGETGTGLTATGMIIGSPEYMSPEQASGETRLDHRSDLYSLGVVAYQMLTGDLPFRAPTVQALLLRHLTDEAPPVTAKRPDCPADLAAAVARCLAKEIKDRWASAEELHRALVEGTATAPVRARRTPPPQVLAPPPATVVLRFRRHVVAFAGGTVAAFAADLFTNGSIEFAPIVVIVWAGVVASQYAKVWTAGYAWRDVLHPPAPRPSGTAVSDSAEFGEQALLVQQARNDRAAIVAAVQRLPHVDRDRLREVLPAVDRLTARTAELARQAHLLEREIGERRRRKKELAEEADSRGARAGDYRETRLAGLDRGIAELDARRAEGSSHLRRCLEALGRVREELERAPADVARLREVLANSP